MEPSADPPLDEVKYFVSSPPPPGLNFGYHTAAISGELNIKDGCLRIGKYIPTLDHELTFSEDDQGLYLKHIYEEKKYRIGDIVSGGGGYMTALPGQSREGCKPEVLNGNAYFVSFYMSRLPPPGIRTDCSYGQYGRGDGMCVPYPSLINCPKGSTQMDDGTCEVIQALRILPD